MLTRHFTVAVAFFAGWASSTSGLVSTSSRTTSWLCRSASRNYFSCSHTYPTLALTSALLHPPSLAFHTSLGLAGLWIGQCVALFLVGVGEYILVTLTHWDVEVEKSQARLDHGDEAGPVATA